MSETFSGIVSINRSGGTVATVRIDGQNGNLRLGGDGSDGDLAILDRDGVTRFNFSGDGMEFIINAADGTRVVTMGPNGNITLGGGGHDGDLLLRRADGTQTVHLDGQEANLWLGGSGTDGDIVLFPSSVPSSNNTGTATIHLDGNAGDIILRNADCAEDFDAAEANIGPGTVLVIDNEGRLKTSSEAYDRRVAGVVSGAGNYKPGIVLDRQPGEEDRVPIAMVGKAYCLAEANQAPIRIGDLVTTSMVPGRAMVASDSQRAFGSVIGKALGNLESGLGMIPILVGLQ